MKTNVVELKVGEIQELIERLDREALTKEDLQMIKAIIKSYQLLTEALQDKKASIKKLLRILFGEKTEKGKKILSTIAYRAKAGRARKDKAKAGKKACGHGRKGAVAYTGAEKITVSHPTMKTGDKCPGCDKGKVYPSVDVGVIVRITGGAPLRSEVWETEKLRCNLCGEIYTAPLPEGVGSEKYDETAGAMIPLLRYGSGMPLNRLEQLQESLGSPVAASTQWEISEKVASGGPSVVYDELMRQAAQGHTIHNDDTTMKILTMDNTAKDEGRQTRCGIYTTGILSIVEDKKIALFCTGSNHAGENMSTVLSQRDPQMSPPIQMCDALSRNTSKEFQTILANCLAHARRKFVDVAESFPDECGYVIEKLSEVYKNDKVAKEQGMSPSMRLEYHQTNSGPPMKQLYQWMGDQIDSKKVEPNSGVGKAITYMLKRWEQLTLFLRVQGAPLDNNICEQALKRAILHRRNSLFYKTLRGAKVGDIFMSLIHTCKLAKVNPFEYLVALQRHTQAVFEHPEKWLPWNYKTALAALPA